MGAHVSVAGGFAKAIERTLEMGATALQIFTCPPRGFSAPALDEAEVAKFRAGVAAHGLYAVAHMPYLPNLASPDTASHRRSVKVFLRELERSRALGLHGLVVHLGSHLGKGEELGRRRVAEALKEALAESPAGEDAVPILLENTARTKNSIGNDWEELADFIERAGGDERLAVCLDTCHALAAGHDIRDEEGVDAVVRSLEKNLGLSRLACIHLNDSKVKFGGCADRHENLGRGYIGKRGIAAVLNHPQLRRKPVILETPITEKRGHKEDLRLARRWIEEHERKK